MTSVAVYYAGIPAKNNKSEKRQVLTEFASGVRQFSDDVITEIEAPTYSPTNLAVIQGWVHEASQNVPHLMFRKAVIDGQRQSGGHTIAIDSNLFLYRDPGNTKSYLRFSLDGVFPTTGNYFGGKVDPLRWEKIKKDLNFDLKPWRTEGEHILICLQRNGGWSMSGLDVMTWCYNLIDELRKHTKRHIVLRAHPGDRAAKNYLRAGQPKVHISNNPNILEDMKNAWAVITYNSSPGVAAAIEGIPVFVTDPTPQRSQAFDVANIDLSQIENPHMPDRLEWIQRISMSHWNFEDLRTGEAWKHMRGFL